MVQILGTSGRPPRDWLSGEWLAQAARHHVQPERAPTGCQEFHNKLKVATSTHGDSLERGMHETCRDRVNCVEMQRLSWKPEL